MVATRFGIGSCTRNLLYSVIHIHYVECYPFDSRLTFPIKRAWHRIDRRLFCVSLLADSKWIHTQDFLGSRCNFLKCHYWHSRHILLTDVRSSDCDVFTRFRVFPRREIGSTHWCSKGVVNSFPIWIPWFIHIRPMLPLGSDYIIKENLCFLCTAFRVTWPYILTFIRISRLTHLYDIS